jgi:hypothetical protein
MEPFERFVFTELSDQSVIEIAASFNAEGIMQQRGDYCYLNIDDCYIHQLYPLLAHYERVEKPDYFNEPNPIGAHISVIYPEEMVRVLPSQMDEKHRFSVSGLIKAQYGTKDYFLLSVVAPSLSVFRQLQYLSPRPIWKRQDIMFHIYCGYQR